MLVSSCTGGTATVPTGTRAAGAPSDVTTVAPTPEGAQDVMGLPDWADLTPGTYFIDPDADPATPLRVSFEVAAEGWVQWIGAVKFASDGHVALSITVVTNLVRDGCHDHSPAEPPVGPTVDDLAAALSSLAPFVVSSPPSDATVFGYHGKHLELTVPDLEVVGSGDHREFADCVDGQLHSWISAIDNTSFYGYNAEPGRTEEFWILDVDGTRLVFVTNQSPAAPPQDVAEARAIFDSIQIQT